MKRRGASAPGISPSVAVLRSIIDTAMDGFWLATTQGRLLEVNETYCRMSGYSRTELLGMRILDLDIAIDPDPVTSPIVKWVIEQGEHRFETRHRRKDGTLFDVEVSVQYRPDAEGQLVAFLRDITEGKRTAEALRASEARYRSMLDTSPDAVGLIDLEGRIRMVSPATLTLLRCRSQEDLLGRPVTDLLVPEDRARALEHIAAILNGLPPSPTEYTGLRSDGSTIAIEVNSQFIRGADGRPTEMILLIRDITERKRAAADLQQSHDMIAKLTAQVPGVVYQYRLYPDGHSCFPFASPAAWEIYEVTPEEVREDATPAFRRLHPDDLERVSASIFESARTLDPFHCEFRVVLPRQGLRWRLCDAMPERMDDGGTLWHGIISDITERKEADDALRLSLKEKESLLREVHHRVKNNLQVIASLLRLETSRSGVADTKRVLKDMQGRILSMAVLHETLYRSGRFGQVELGAYLRQLGQQLFRATSGSARLSVDLSPVLVEIDQAIPCGLIVNELLTNSLKHAFAEGSGGEVRMSLALDPQGEVQFAVTDTGVGLPDDFEARRGRSLGLQLVTDLVRQIGGHLAISPGPGAGFAVTFAPVLNHATMQSPGPAAGSDPHRR